MTKPRIANDFSRLAYGLVEAAELLSGIHDIDCASLNDELAKCNCGIEELDEAVALFRAKYP